MEVKQIGLFSLTHLWRSLLRGYKNICLSNTLKEFHCRHTDLVEQCKGVFCNIFKILFQSGLPEQRTMPFKSIKC